MSYGAARRAATLAKSIEINRGSNRVGAITGELGLTTRIDAETGSKISGEPLKLRDIATCAHLTGLDIDQAMLGLPLRQQHTTRLRAGPRRHRLRIYTEIRTLIQQRCNQLINERINTSR